MFKVRKIVLSVLSAFAIGGCASLDQFSDRALHAFKRPEAQRAELTAEQLYRLGRQYQERSRYDEAVVAYLTALERDGSLVDARNALGVIYADEGKYQQAMEQFRAAIELKPNSAYLHNNLGYVLLLQGLDRDALAPLEEANRLEPTDEKIQFNLRLAHERLGESQQKVSTSAAVDASPSAAQAKDLTARSTPGNAADPHLVAVAPGVYELKISEYSQPEVAPLQPLAFEEKALPSPGAEPKQTTRKFKLELSNGNGAPGLARRVARLLETKGIHTGRITNHPGFNQANTQIQYRKGYLTEASALQNMFPGEMKPVGSPSLRSDIHVRVVLGKDVPSAAALRQPAASALVAAHTTAAEQK